MYIILIECYKWKENFIIALKIESDVHFGSSVQFSVVYEWNK